MSLAARSAVLVALLACFAAGAAVVVVMDVAGPMAGLALPVAAAVAAVVGVRPILGVQLAVLAVPLEFFSLRVGGETGLSPTEMLLLVSAGATLVRWSVTVARPQVPMVLRAATATCVLIALGYGVAEDTLIVTKILVMWSAFVIAAVLVANSDEREITRLMFCVAIAGGIAGFVAVAGGSNQSLVEGGLIATNRAQASFAQPNVLGFFLVLAIPAAVVLAVRGRGVTRAFMALMAAGAVWGLMLSLSRTSLIGTFLALGILLLWPDFRRWPPSALAALAMFALFELAGARAVAADLGRHAAAGHARPQTTVESDPRLEMWKTTPKIIAANPLLGVGAGNYSVAAKRYGAARRERPAVRPRPRRAVDDRRRARHPGPRSCSSGSSSRSARWCCRAIEARGDPVRGALLLALRGHDGRRRDDLAGRLPAAHERDRRDVHPRGRRSGGAAATRSASCHACRAIRSSLNSVRHVGAAGVAQPPARPASWSSVDRRREGARVVGVDEQPVDPVAHDLGRAAGAGRDDRDGARHRLGDHEPERLELGGVHEHVEPGAPRVVLVAGERHRRAAGAQLGLVGRVLSPADHLEARVGPLGEHERRGVEQPLDPLPALEPRDGAHAGAVAGRRRRRGRRAGMDPLDRACPGCARAAARP